jgi:hypothetical protein
MKKYLLLVLMLVIPKIVGAATASTITWGDAGYPQFLGRSTVSDGFVMNHLYSAQVNVYSEERSIIKSSGWVTGSASAQTGLTLAPWDLGNYWGTGVLRVDCPYNYYDFYATPVAQTFQGGRSGSCYKIKPGLGECYRDPWQGGPYYGDYDRIDQVDPYPECNVRCRGPIEKLHVGEQLSGGCYPTRMMYRYYIRQGASVICYGANGTWWGTGACNNCNDSDADCGCP